MPSRDTEIARALLGVGFGRRPFCCNLGATTAHKGERDGYVDAMQDYA
jgi:hypothetical protein